MGHLLHYGTALEDFLAAPDIDTTSDTWFDPAWDVRGFELRHGRDAVRYFFKDVEPAGDLWVSFFFRSSRHDTLVDPDAIFMTFDDADGAVVAEIKPVAATNLWHARALGDTIETGASGLLVSSRTDYWFDVRVSVGAVITVEFHVDGALASQATASNTGGRGKPRRVGFWVRGHYSSNRAERTGFGNIAMLDGVSSLGRRFLRLTPNAAGAFDQWSGGVADLADGAATAVSTASSGQRQSFTVSGPPVPSGGTVAAVHVMAAARGGANAGRLAGSVRVGGVDYDTASEVVDGEQRRLRAFTFEQDPSTGLAWTTAGLPWEAGLVSDD